VIVGAGAGITVNHYKERGELNWFPDWGFDVILFVVLLLGVYWLWTQPDIQSAVRLAYNRRPNMLLVILVIVGMVVGGGFGLFGFWRVKRYEALRPETHFESNYAPIADVPDGVVSFFPALRGKPITFRARIGYGRDDMMMRLVIDLPEGSEFEVAQYAAAHRQEITDRLRRDIQMAHPELLEIPLDQYMILQHRHRLHPSSHVRIAAVAREKVNEAKVLVEGPELPFQ